MPRFKNYLVLTAAFTAAVALSGCGKQGGSPPYPAAEPATSQSPTDAEATDRGKIEEALAELSETDRTAAKKQGTCAVTGKQLGSMGKPPKITVAGQEVFMCCAGCEEELRSKPEMYLAKLKQ